MRIVQLIIITLCLASCASPSINNRYVNANWQAVAISPVSGKQSDIVEMEFDRLLSISDSVVVFNADRIRLEIHQRGLQKEFEQQPQKVMFDLAKELNIDGVLFTQVKASKFKNQFTGVPSISLYSKLISAKNKAVVSAIHEESLGFASSQNSNISELVESTVNELNEVLEQINPPQEQSWFEQLF